MMKRPRRFAAKAGITALAATLGVTLLTAPPAFAAVEDLPWMDTSLSHTERANLLIDAMTLEQKMLQIAMNPHDNAEHGLEDCDYTRIGRHIESIPELGIPVVRMTNGPSGVGGGDCAVDPEATGLPSGIGVAASFDQANAYAWGDLAGAEVRASAHSVFLAPGLNLGRVAQAGRNFEYFGEDPYLTGVMGVEQIKAIQSHNVHANAKHFAFNEQETGRRTMNIIVPPRAAHELYLLPFEMAVKDGDVASMMCSFPRIEGAYACQNKELLTDTLRERWGFDGYVLSDRRATITTVPSIKWGLDLEFAQRNRFSLERLQMFLDAGEISEADFDRMLFNRYSQMFKFGLFENPVDDYEDIDLAAHGTTARDIGEDGVVLLKNEGGTLPLNADEIDTIALLGPEHFAGEAKLGPNAPNITDIVEAPYTITPEEGLNNVLESLGSDATVEYTQTRNVATAAAAAAAADVAIVMVGDLSVEGQDRPTLNLEGPGTYEEGQDGHGVIEIDQEDLISAVVAANPNTVVVLKNGGPIVMPWLDEVPAVLEAWYPGQEDGNIVANNLFGVVNPSGKLPMTFPNNDHEAAAETVRQFPGTPLDEDGGVAPDPEFGDEDSIVRESEYTEDLEMGYRWYEANGVAPAFPFGFGLSYTSFEYGGLALTPTQGVTGERALTVDFTVTNTGDVAGAEAAQVYLTLPDAAGQPTKRLVGFEKPYLEPGASAQVSVTIDAAASNHPFSYFVPDPDGTWADGEWATAAGSYTVHVGGSSADTPLEQAVTLAFPAAQNTGEIPIAAEIPDVTEQPGSLTLQVGQYSGLVEMAYTKNVDRHRFDGDLPTIVVTDSRSNTQAGDSGWSVAGQASEFVAGEESFGAEHLGWLPWTTAEDKPGLDAGPRVDGVLRGGPGLADPATLVSATSEGRYGAATAGAHLLLEVPLTQAPGDYRSTLTLSLFPVD